MNEKIRAVIQSDIDGLKKVVDSSELFPSEYLDEMISDYFNNLNSEEIWFTPTSPDLQSGFLKCAFAMHKTQFHLINAQLARV